MKTLCLTTSVSRKAGGLFQSVRHLHLALSRLDKISVEVFGVADEFTAADLPQWQSLTVQALPVRGPSSFSYAPGLKPALARGQFDLLHVHGIWQYPSVAARYWHRRTGRPYLISPRGMLDPWALRNSHWKKRFAGWLFENAQLRGAACLHALCESEAQAMRAYGLKNPICIIPNGIDPYSFQNLPPRARLEERFPALRGRRWVLFLSRIHPKKGLPHLLSAWAKIKQGESGNRKFADWLLVIAGPDELNHESAVKQLVVDLDLATSVCFTGPLHGEDKRAALGGAELFVLPSFSEGFSMAILEAAAAGLPVLLTPQCNFPELVQAGGAFEVLPEAVSCEVGLRQLLALPDPERQAMGQRGKFLVGHSYSWTQIADQMLDVYGWLTERGSVPACVRLHS